jgi:hypothetical protein
MTTSTEILPVPPGWPEALAPAAYHGLAGDIVNTIAPHTEADPVAVLVQLLVACGALIGRGAWFQVGPTRHHPNEFVILVGDSARSRMDSSFDHVAKLLDQVDPDFESRISCGLSSGRKLVWALRDSHGEAADARDHRLLVTEFELTTVLKARRLSTLSSVLRQAWDGETLELLTRGSHARASEAHIAVIGHITAAELNRYTTIFAGGLLKRFIFVACRRTQLLPEGGDGNPLAKAGLKARLAAALERAKGAGELRLHSSAKEHWGNTYIEMSKRSTEGVTGALTARAEAHCIRLALIYALLDGASSIKLEHLEAALALWEYAASSAAWALGDSTDRHKIPTDSEIPALTQQAA